MDPLQSSSGTFAEETITVLPTLGHAQGKCMRQVSAVRRGIMQASTSHITRQAQ